MQNNYDSDSSIKKNRNKNAELYKFIRRHREKVRELYMEWYEERNREWDRMIREIKERKYIGSKGDCAGVLGSYLNREPTEHEVDVAWDELGEDDGVDKD